MYNKRYEALVNELNVVFNEDVLWEHYASIARYINLIKTSIDNLDAISVEFDQLDDDIMSNVDTFIDVIKDYFNFKVNFTYPAVQDWSWLNLNGLILFNQFKLIKWYTFKIIEELRNNGWFELLNDNIKKWYNEYMELQRNDYANFRKEKAEYLESLKNKEWEEVQSQEGAEWKAVAE